MAGCASAQAARASQRFYTPAPVPVLDGKAALTPALNLLREGNVAFLAGRTAQLDLGAQRRLELAKGQTPFVAYKAAMDVVESNARFSGAIDDMIEPIIPAVLAARNAAGDKTEAAIKANVSRTVRRLRDEADPIMLEPQKAGRLKVVGACYSLSSGAVEFFDV